MYIPFYVIIFRHTSSNDAARFASTIPLALIIIPFALPPNSSFRVSGASAFQWNLVNDSRLLHEAVVPPALPQLTSPSEAAPVFSLLLLGRARCEGPAYTHSHAPTKSHTRPPRLSTPPPPPQRPTVGARAPPKRIRDARGSLPATTSAIHPFQPSAMRASELVGAALREEGAGRKGRAASHRMTLLAARSAPMTKYSGLCARSS
jgi:hypothetical protein